MMRRFAVTFGGVALTLAERWDGKKWVIVPTPAPKGLVTGLLSSVSCRSATACVAVGNDDVTTRGLTPNPAALAEALPGRAVVVTLAEGWNGKKWAIEP